MNPPRIGISLYTAALFCAALLVMPNAFASTFRLQSNTVILDEREGRVSFNVRNLGQHPMLLVTRVEDLDDQDLSARVLVSPPITRVDPGQSQQVNFVLKKGAPLQREVLLKASFEGITQKLDGATVAMPVRQEIGFLIQAASVPRSDSPWQALKFSQQGDGLVVENTGQRVVRLDRALTLLPANTQASLDNAFLMPGEKRHIATAGQVQEVGFTPMSRFGFLQTAVTLPVTR